MIETQSFSALALIRFIFLARRSVLFQLAQSPETYVIFLEGVITMCYELQTMRHLAPLPEDVAEGKMTRLI